MSRRLLLAARGGGGSSVGPPAAPVHIAYIAHADDDGLWMDLALANAALDGAELHTVCLTGMEGDAVYALLTGTGGVCPIHGVTHSYTMTYPQFTSYRDAEGAANAGVLGGAYHTPADRQVGGGLTSSYTEGIIAAYLATYPDAYHHVLSWVDKYHVDHRATGFALRNLVDNGTVASDHAIFHLRTEDMAAYDGTEVVAEPGASVLAVAALEAYTFWDPGANRYAIGYHSVKALFDDQIAAPHNKTHTAAQNR